MPKFPCPNCKAPTTWSLINHKGIMRCDLCGLTKTKGELVNLEAEQRMAELKDKGADHGDG